jgi:hypothetical protein
MTSWSWGLYQLDIANPSFPSRPKQMSNDVFFLTPLRQQALRRGDVRQSLLNLTFSTLSSARFLPSILNASTTNDQRKGNRIIHEANRSAVKRRVVILRQWPLSMPSWLKGRKSKRRRKSVASLIHFIWIVFETAVVSLIDWRKRTSSSLESRETDETSSIVRID